jgi:hypothetical protein
VRVILALLLELPLSKMSCFEVDYASLTWVEIQPHKTEIQLLNFTPWRDLAGARLAKPLRPAKGAA